MTKSDKDWNPTSFGFDLEENNRKILLKFWHIGWSERNAHFILFLGLNAAIK